MNIELRDFLAATIELDTKINGIELAEQLIGRSCPSPDDGVLAVIKFGYDTEAKLRYMKADAMLAAREAGKPEKKAEKKTDDSWIQWYGGECPVAPDTVVDVRFHNLKTAIDFAGRFDWARDSVKLDIIAYRVVQP